MLKLLAVVLVIGPVLAMTFALAVNTAFAFGAVHAGTFYGVADLVGLFGALLRREITIYLTHVA